MIILGKDRKFLLSTAAYYEIAAMCPNGDIKNIEAILSQNSTTEYLKNITKVAVIMNKWYEEYQKFSGEETQPPLTEEEINLLPLSQFNLMTAEILQAFTEGQKTTVDVVNKKNEKSQV